MAAIEEGRKCMVVAGRRAGCTVTIVKVFPNGFASARDEKDRERKYAIRHLEPLSS